MTFTNKKTCTNQFAADNFYFLPLSAFQFGIFFLAVTIICGSNIVNAQSNPMRSNTPSAASAPNAAAGSNTISSTTNQQSNQTLDKEIQEAYDKATAAFKESKFDEALDILKTIYAKRPETTPPRILMASMFAQAKLGEAVRAALEMGTEETPNDPEAYLLLGEIALRQGNLTATDLLLRKAAETVNGYSANITRKKNLTISTLRLYSTLYEVRRRWEQMEQCIDQLIQQEGQNATLLRRKGIAIFNLKRDDEAKKIFLQADQLDQTNKGTDPKGTESKGLPADAAMSQLYLTRGDKDTARKYLEAALATYPKSKDVLILTVQMRINDDKLEEAMPIAQKLLAEDPTSAPARRLCATVALYLQNYTLAEDLFQNLLLESPSDAQAQNGLALALCEQDKNPEKLKRALEYAVDNVRKNQNNGEFWGTLGWIQYKLNNLNDAENSLRRAASTGSINAATAYYTAKLAMKNNKNDDAKQFLTLALKGDHQFAKRREAAKLLNELTK
ncbi:MAG: tetratricopeptide repeat protein [Planctomycetaceae bacterium]|jgi:tetratricopeptide (TPR) repeat protein|nr:tetratricopeptide repeat protein [Planctomycetaceae bacterium]